MTGGFDPGTAGTSACGRPTPSSLSGWLMTVDLNTIPVGHKAQKQALADLLTALETQVPVAGATQAQIDQAQHEISERHGLGITAGMAARGEPDVTGPGWIKAAAGSTPRAQPRYRHRVRTGQAGTRPAQLPGRR